VSFTGGASPDFVHAEIFDDSAEASPSPTPDAADTAEAAEVPIGLLIGIAVGVVVFVGVLVLVVLLVVRRSRRRGPVESGSGRPS